MRKNKVRRKQAMAWICAFALSIVSVLPVKGIVAQVRMKEAKTQEHVLQNPVIAAEDGKITWDCVYFGNYWQSKYITQPENRPQAGEDDVEHTDTDGTRYLVREDKNCYRYDPIKWRVLSVSEDGKEAFLLADKNLDIHQYHPTNDDTVTWETSELRDWMNADFINKAFTENEQDAIIETEVENKRNPYTEDDTIEDEDDTLDKVYLLSLEEATTRAYGFTTDLEKTETRDPNGSNTAFVESGGFSGGEWTWNDYWLRTLGTERTKISYVSDTGAGSISFSMAMTDNRIVRPVLHLDLTKTELWSYAGQVKQDKTDISPDATPIVPTPSPTPRAGVTMAPNQVFPKNLVINTTNLDKNTWDCIYFGKYYITKFTPSVLSPSGDHDTMQEDEEGNRYLVRHDEGYFRYEPIKWRVLSINKDGTDAFLMADQALDLRPYYSEDNVEITWEKSDVRRWLNHDFSDAAFTENEKNVILDSTVTTGENPWSGETGGNDTTDKIYLLSIEEALNTSYGFSSDETEGETRKFQATDYATVKKQLEWAYSDVVSYWLRSQGSSVGKPAYVGSFGDGEVLHETANRASERLGIRPVIHVDLTNTSLWKYAGQVTPEGVIEPVKEGSIVSPTPVPTKPQTSVVQPQKTTTTTQIKKPAKPSIKKLKNVKGKKVKLTLTKNISGATGYQVAYATKSSMKKQKVKSFKGSSVTIKGLKKKKTYYFRVRAYKKQNGKTVYSSGGKKKRIKINK